MISSERSP